MIPFNKPFMTGSELENIAAAHRAGHLSGDGPFTKKCHLQLQEICAVPKALLTHSCTAALEMAAILLDLKPGDEVILPSFTFVSTVNAFALRGAVPVFVDIRQDTLNLDEAQIESAITTRTKAICVVHYAGMACEMDTIMDIAARHGLPVVEDAAQAIYSTYRGRPLGGIGDYGCLSFHETKNVISGEGGALLVRDPANTERAEIIREKGTNRSRFLRGQVDKYTWVDLGSSYLPSELIAAFLAAQLDSGQEITQRRLGIWDRYHAWAQKHEQAGLLRRPVVPDNCDHNAHMYYILLPNLSARTRFIENLRNLGVASVFHYVPLHSSPKGKEISRSHGDLAVTEDISSRLVRLPLWVGLEAQVQEVMHAADAALASI
ncbi:dTDP-4-amino-4,6-dideoxygalactose transaminase [Xanthomonas cannabis]|uniref:dTDP-4-amino-4,6-dideoxygalactose transaminase n=1 Tax=Xanthomonas cannabis TaxID=1885674 RepID=A0ABR6JG46_9XANT|nr:dTDP-4-amino-4,6-dideoxygalactose transaminase [Xanthomonas cannabis]MBB4591468.1 dTDP-4-amino-4,6-dideoxygalactose transaminase [Xanthomonas cannabis]MBB5521317.1 dTDP-4-amino-4,6-dideoxygalactose transaminase [Xanthomonas cannabis]